MGILVCLLMKEEDMLTPAIVMFVVGMLLISTTLKKTRKLVAKNMTTCTKCKQSLAGARYRYEYDRSKYNKVYDTIPVTFYIECPHCGKENFQIENVEIYSQTSSKEIESTIEAWMDGQLEELDD